MQNHLSTNVIEHMAIIVKDIEAAKKRYADTFGIEEPPTIVTDTADKAHTQYHGQPSEARAKLAFLQMGPIKIELIEPMGGPSTWQEFLDKHGEGVHHIAFTVKDIPTELKHLEGRGVPLVQKGDYTGGCYAYADSEKPLGVVLEFLQSVPVK